MERGKGRGSKRAKEKRGERKKLGGGEGERGKNVFERKEEKKKG